MEKYYFATITIESAGIEAVERFLILVIGRAAKALIKKFDKDFYGGKLDRDDGMYVIEDDYGTEIRHTPADVREISKADYEVLARFLPSHTLRS